MADEADSKPMLICVVQPPEDPLPAGFKIGDSIEELKAWAADPSLHPGSQSVGEGGDGHKSKDENFNDLLTRIVKSSHQQMEMLSILRMVRSVFPMITFKDELLDAHLSHRKVVYEENKFKIIEFVDSDIQTMINVMGRVSHLQNGLDYVPNALLLSLVSTFDGHMSDVVRSMLRVRSDRLKSGERKVSLSEILEASSLSELINNAITDEVYAFSRNSHDEQIKYIEESFSINIRKHWKRWPDFIEIFERRNLVAHGESEFTSRYCSICAKANHKGSEKLKGKKVLVTFNYLKQSLEILVEFLVLCIFSLWRKHVSDKEEECYHSVNEIIYELILNNQPLIATRVSEYVLSLKTDALRESVRLRIVVNLASAQKHLGQNDAAEKTLQGEDWSATSENYATCVAALRNDIPTLRKLLPVVKATGSIEAESFKTWPVFKYVRVEKEFQELYEETFGVKLIDQKIDTRDAVRGDIDSKIMEDSSPEAADDTIH